MVRLFPIGTHVIGYLGPDKVRGVVVSAVHGGLYRHYVKVTHGALKDQTTWIKDASVDKHCTLKTYFQC